MVSGEIVPPGTGDATDAPSTPVQRSSKFCSMQFCRYATMPNDSCCTVETDGPHHPRCNRAEQSAHIYIRAITAGVHGKHGSIARLGKCRA